MSASTRPFSEEHEHLLEHVEHVRQAAIELPELDVDGRKLLLARVQTFLHGTLIPHAEAEERVLYPAVGELLGHPEATAPMVHDHLVIKEHTAALAETEPDDVQRLQELLYGLYALVVAHFRKEEELYLPLLERDPAKAELLIEEMAGEHVH